MPASNPSIFWHYYHQNKAESTAMCKSWSCRQVLKKSMHQPQDLICTTTFRKEFNCFETTGEKSSRLKMLYDAQITIKPTSVDSERSFSNVGRFWQNSDQDCLTIS